MAISPELPDHSLSTVEKNELSFEVLSDAGNKVARQFGLVFQLPEDLRPLYLNWGIDLAAHNGDESSELPVPGTFVVGQDHRVILAAVNPDYTRRLEPAEIVDSLRAAAGKQIG